MIRLALLLGVGPFAATLAQAETLYLLAQDGTLSISSTAQPTPTSAPITLTGVFAGETLVAIDVRPQNQLLYALGVNATTDTATLYLVEPRTGIASPIGTPGQITFTSTDFPNPASVAWDIDFNPVVDRVRVVAGSLNFRLNPNTGAAVDGDLGGSAVVGVNPDGPINGATTSLSAGAYTNNSPNTSITTLYTIDDASNALFIQNPPNAGTQTSSMALTLGGSPVDISQTSFDIPPGVNVASNNAAVTTGSGYLVTRIGGGNSFLYSLNLTNGTLSQIGSTSLNVRSFALQTELGAAIAMSADGSTLIRFNPNAPGITTSASISGITSGETLVGIDLRPQTGQLYGLGINATSNTGTLYLLDPQSAAATAVGTPGSIAFTDALASPIDFPPASAGWGFDFNPTVDRIRVTTGTGLNFRLNPLNGSAVDGNNGGSTAIAGVNPDGNQNGLPSGSTGASAAGYTNSYAQSLTGGVTTLYTLDSQSDSLYIQNPPNGGTQSMPLSLTSNGGPLDIQSIGGFDIPKSVTVTTSNAPADGDGWFISKVTGVTHLYRLHLATGTTVDYGNVASGNTEINGLAVFATPPALEAYTSSGSLLADITGSIHFGTSSVNTPVTTTIRLVNRGSQPIFYNTSFTSGSKFSATSNGSAMIPGSSSIIVTLQFNSSTGGNFTDTLRIASNDPLNSEYTLTLSGTTSVPQTDDTVTTTSGATRLNPLANDTLPGDVTLVSVSDPSIRIEGRTLILPSGYSGQFTYTTSNGTLVGQGTVTANSAASAINSRGYNGVLVSSSGKVRGWAKARITGFGNGSIRIMADTGNGLGRLIFNGARTVVSNTKLGPITVDRLADGQVGAYAVSLNLGGEEVLTGVLHAEAPFSPMETHHLELASIHPDIPGGGYAALSLTRNASVRIRGLLPDGTSFTGATTVTDNQAIAFYSMITNRANPPGMIGGDLTLADLPQTDLSGELVWIKPAQVAGTSGLHLGGVDTILRANGSRFDRSLGLSSGVFQLEVSGGNLLADEYSNNTVTNGVPTTPIGSLLTWAAVPNSGTFSFTATVPGQPQAAKGTGLYLQKSGRAIGFFPGTNEGGRVSLGTAMMLDN